jgi:hypothetical protein
MVIPGAFLSLLAGFATVMLGLGAFRLLLSRVAREWAHAETKWGLIPFLVHLGSTFLAAALGGFVTAWIEAANPLPEVLVLGVIVLVMGGASALESRGKQPIGYLLALAAIAPIGVVVGGLVRLHFVGAF